MKKKVLNLYSGIGGNRKDWKDVEVTAVELNPDIAKIYRDNFPNDIVIVGDAHQYLLHHFNEFNFIWSSPPCQSNSRMVKATRHKIIKYPDLALYQEILFLQHFAKCKWVVENVIPYYKPLIPAYKVGRHLFWSNYEIKEFDPEKISGFIKNDSPIEIERMKQRLGISYKKNVYYNGNHSPGQILRNAVLPEVGLHVFKCALDESV